MGKFSLFPGRVYPVENSEGDARLIARVRRIMVSLTNLSVRDASFAGTALRTILSTTQVYPGVFSMSIRKGSALAVTAMATALGFAGFAFATSDDESKLHKAMEQVQAKNSFIVKNVRTAAVFKKSQKEVVEAAKALAQLGKDTRDETEPAKEKKKPQEDWTKLMDAYITECEKFAETAGKADAQQADVKKAYTAVSGTCAACHKDFRPDE